MTKEQRAICALLAASLFGKASEYEKEISWENVYYESIRQTVVNAVIPALPSGVPFEIRMKWINAAGVHGASNYKVKEGHLYLHRLLCEKGIPYCILKGLSSARFYPDPEMRTLGDVDFIVSAEDTERCDAVLKEAGFAAEENRLPYEWGYKKDGLEYELHLRVNGIPEGKEGAAAKEYLSDMIKTAKACESFGGPVMLPDDFHHGLVILLHTAKHMVGEGVGFRQIADWAVFAARTGEKLPEMLKGPLQKTGLWDFCLALSTICVRFMGMPAFSWIPQYDGDFLNRLLDDMIRAGNFRRESDTGVRSILVEKTDSGGLAEGSAAGQLFKNLGQKVKYKWPVMNRVKILIPFGIPVMCAQYGIGVLTGKYKKIDPKELISEAKERRRLYGELNLFKGKESD